MIRLHRRPNARTGGGNLLADEATLQHPEAEPSVLFGKVRVHEPELPRLLHYVHREFPGLIVVGRVRGNLVLRKLT